jgi:ubiquinone/menaquinone biosynthesis C-methylase UbiE
MQVIGALPKNFLYLGMKMSNEVKLLDASLLGEDVKLKELTYWLRVMNRPNGWHYDLDIIWILNQLEAVGIKPGATILDAGAGQGVMQYLLAARGYNVISLDFSPRKKPIRSFGIFNIVGDGASTIDYQHSYMNFISYDAHSKIEITNTFNDFPLHKIFELPQRFLRFTTSLISYCYERFIRSHEFYGKITYLRAPFHDVPLESNSVDAVISVSAIEHADINLFNQNIDELLRLVKVGGLFLMTTSATSEEKNAFHSKTSGWCFSISALREFFPLCKFDFDLMACTKSLMSSEKFRDRLDPYYYRDKSSFCFNRKIEKFPYLPVAIKLIK